MRGIGVKPSKDNRLDRVASLGAQLRSLSQIQYKTVATFVIGIGEESG